MADNGGMKGLFFWVTPGVEISNERMGEARAKGEARDKVGEGSGEKAR